MLKIIKKGNKNFTHIDPDFPNQYGANDITIIFDGNTVKLRSFNGRVIFRRDGYDLSEVIVMDESASSVDETFTDVNLLKQRLISLGYPFACNGGGGDGPSSGIEDIFAGDNISINKDDPNNPVISAGFDDGIDGGTP